MVDTHPEFGKVVVNGSKKARIDTCHTAEFDDGKELAVFKHTFYSRKWYYDGYIACFTIEEAITERNKWLNS